MKITNVKINEFERLREKNEQLIDSVQIVFSENEAKEIRKKYKNIYKILEYTENFIEEDEETEEEAYFIHLKNEESGYNEEGKWEGYLKRNDITYSAISSLQKIEALLKRRKKEQTEREIIYSQNKIKEKQETIKEIQERITEFKKEIAELKQKLAELEK